ncbi:hypothetical protein [Streptomyces sp. NPDC047009]|uniref:hypothetical protein n=1 Tax=unclassified Streptomyces TaxID=2593676 RepID=UPI0033F0FBF9
MDTEVFWRVLDTANDGDNPLAVAVADHLSALPLHGSEHPRVGGADAISDSVTS